MKFDLRIIGMSCHHCVKSVRAELEKIEGLIIHDVEIGKALVELPESPESRNILARAVERSGYKIETIN